MVNNITLFFAGLFLANGVPHFVNGISGRQFHNPFLHRFVPDVPSPLFNVIWGILNFALVLILLNQAKIVHIQINRDTLFFMAGFCFAAIGLSILFNRPISGG